MKKISRQLTRDEKIKLWAEIEGTSLGNFCQQDNTFLDETWLELILKKMREDFALIQSLHHEYGKLVDKDCDGDS